MDARMGQNSTLPKVMDLGFRSPSYRHAEDLIRADQQNPQHDEKPCLYRRAPSPSSIKFLAKALCNLPHDKKSIRESLNLRFEKPQ
jgi:hypothetical protein